MTPDPTPKLIPFEAVAKQLPLGDRPTDRAAKAALRRLIARANDVRHDRKLPPLRPIRIGKEDFYRPDFVDVLIESLSA
ncbi:MAG: hypothetical protein AMXMBFR13_34640 [Phycisphaerae bacterium]